jgi:phage shock protein A
MVILPAPQDDWLKRAELAVSKGEDELAREALKRRKAYQVRARLWRPAPRAAAHAFCARDDTCHG